jgi:hypothetical protein
MIHLIVVAWLVSLGSLSPSLTWAQTCGNNVGSIFNPSSDCTSALACEGKGYWSKCSAGNAFGPPTTGYFCKPFGVHSSNKCCKCEKAEGQVCGEVAGMCASAAACSGTSRGFLAPCAYGEQCQTFGPDPVTPCCGCVKPPCQPSKQHSKIVAQGRCVGGANAGQPCKGWRQCVDCPGGECVEEIPDYEFAAMMRQKLIQGGVSNVRDAKFLFQTCHGGGMLDDLSARRCSVTTTQCCYHASDCPAGETCDPDPNRGLGTVVPWVGGSAAAWDESAWGPEKRCAVGGRDCVTAADCAERCVGGPNNGLPCGQCPGGACNAGTCAGGANHGQPCGPCPNGPCPGGVCNAGTGVCNGGANNNQPCAGVCPVQGPCRIPPGMRAYIGGPPLTDASGHWTQALLSEINPNPNQPLTQSIDGAIRKDNVGPNGNRALEHGENIVENGGEGITLADPGAASHHAILWAGDTNLLGDFNEIGNVRNSLLAAWNPTCVGGGNAGQPCSKATDCTGGTCPATITVLYGDGVHHLEDRCVGGRNATKGCDCPGGDCFGPLVCSCGADAGQPCGCPGGTCNAGTKTCNGGSRNGQPCGVCAGGICAGTCAGGAHNGQPCLQFCPGGACTPGDPLPAAWDAKAATKQNLQNELNALPLDPNEQFFFYAADHGSLDQKVKPPPPVEPPVVVPPGGTDHEPFEIPRPVLVEMLRTPDNVPTLTISYSGVQTAGTVCVSMPDPVTGIAVALGCLDPALSTMEFIIAESLLWLTNAIDITNNGGVPIEILEKDFFIGAIPIQQEPDECHQGDYPGFAFLVRALGQIGNGAQIAGNVGANDPGGRFQLGKQVFMTDDTFIAADTVALGLGSSVFNVLTNDLQAVNATMRGVRGLPLLPLDPNFCPMPSFSCGGADVVVSSRTTVGPLAPGSYGRLIVLAGGTLTLAPGTFEFCSVKTTKGAIVEAAIGTQTTVNVTGIVRLGNGSFFGPATDAPTPILNVAGKMVRTSQMATLQAFVSIPNGLVSFGRGSTLRGSFCADRSRTDKSVTLLCPENSIAGPTPTTTTTAPTTTSTTTTSTTSTTTTT